jgi:hypothetical protein
MSEDIVIRIPYRVLRELIERADAANDTHPGPIDPPSHGQPWSDKQKRFIYRLLQRLGHQGEAAKQYITEALDLNGAPPTRRQASTLIDQLQDELAMHQGPSRGAA